jgi:hypothetical protein
MANGWKDHPGITAAVAAAGTLTLCATIFMSVVLPTFTTRLQNQLDEANANITKLTNNLKTADATSEIESLKKQTADLHRELRSERLDKLFSSTDVYPLGLRAIRIGDGFETLVSVYGRDAITEDNWLWAQVNIRDSLFSKVTYYKGRCSPKKVTVTHVLFHFDDADTRRIIEDKAREIYGDVGLKKRSSKDGKPETDIQSVHGVRATIGDGTLHVQSTKPLICPLP